MDCSGGFKAKFALWGLSKRVQLALRRLYNVLFVPFTILDFRCYYCSNWSILSQGLFGLDVAERFIYILLGCVLKVRVPRADIDRGGL